MALLASSKYIDGNKSRYVQLTNNAVNKNENNKIVFDQSFNNYDSIFGQVEHICRCIATAYKDLDINSYNAMLGIDIMVDNNKKCWLLEANTPDMDDTGFSYDTLNKKVAHDTVVLLSDKLLADKLSDHEWHKLDLLF